MRADRPAVFLDRDGTIIRDERYLADPARVVPVPGAASAIARFRAAGYMIVVITNQSGLARGCFTAEQYDAVRERIDSVFAAAGAPLDATYMCPHHPEFTGPCECRKPGIELYMRAARDLGLDLRASVLIGDRWRDIAAASALGARGILIPSPDTPAAETSRATREGIAAPTLEAAATAILAS
ncbi:MAG: D-glycero-alpha-D-manno-heptose-1,7-bisphosphate 7-phosphatase [Gemmatimonadales bacterium]|jgi:histidinol-phosphate phosphatase family protein